MDVCTDVAMKDVREVTAMLKIKMKLIEHDLTMTMMMTMIMMKIVM